MLSVADVTDVDAHCGRECLMAQKLCRIDAKRLPWVCELGRGDMIRTFVAAACFACVVAACSACLGATASLAQSAPASPACVYENRSYSDGALICIYRSLMLTCAQDGARASWKPVADPKLAGVCEASSARPRVVEAPPRPHRRHGLRHPVHVQADRSAKCFTFNNKQYCE
jgi:hypothetical protein